MSKTLTMAVPRDGDRVRRPPGDVVGHPPALAVGHVGQRDERGGVRDGIRLLDGIAHGIDVRVVGLVGVVDGDAAARPEVQAGQFGQADVRPDADGADDKLGREHPTVGRG